MKVTIAYSPGEELAARTVEEFARVVFPGLKVKKSDHHPPFLHIYMTTKKAEKHCSIKKNT